MRSSIVFAFALVSFPLYAQAAASIPNDCWSGVMAPDGAPQGHLVATGPVAQWRVGTPITFFPTRESNDQIADLANKGQTATFDTLHPITIVPTSISGPEHGDKDSGEDKDIQLTMGYRDAEGRTGTLLLNFWTPMSGEYASAPQDQQDAIALADQQTHDISCRGIP